MIKKYLKLFFLLILISITSICLSAQEEDRLKNFSQQVINYSIELQKGEKVIIMGHVSDNSIPVIKSLIREIYKAGGIPFLNLYNNEIEREILLNTTEEHMSLMALFDGEEMKAMDCCIFVDEMENYSEFSDVPEENMSFYHQYWEKPVIYDNLAKLKWCYFRCPNKGMAQAARMSTEGFKDFFFKVCSIDYPSMEKAMEPLEELMEKTDMVRITGPGTDLSFSIKGIPVVKCAGRYNLPDGEIFTAPVRDSVNGIITFNTVSSYYGTDFEKICLEFENGKIINATANYSEQLNQILDTDEGSRYTGEFSLGINPLIENVMKDTLFDEKIKGSIHIALGNCYEYADNGNSSAIHWDIVLIQTTEYGVGEIWFDGKLIRKDGLFVLPELEGLNPENLLSD